MRVDDVIRVMPDAAVPRRLRAFELGWLAQLLEGGAAPAIIMLLVLQPGIIMLL